MDFNNIKNFDILKISNGIEDNTYFVYKTSKKKFKLFNLDYPEYKSELCPEHFKGNRIIKLGNLWDQINYSVIDEFNKNSTFNITSSLIGYLLENYNKK